MDFRHKSLPVVFQNEHLRLQRLATSRLGCSAGWRMVEAPLQGSRLAVARVFGTLLRTCSKCVRWQQMVPPKVDIPVSAHRPCNEGIALPNIGRLGNCRSQEGQSLRPDMYPRYSGGGRRLRSFFSSRAFQYLKLSSRCCIRSGRSTKASQASNMSVMK